jgi:hypothetical protein
VQTSYLLPENKEFKAQQFRIKISKQHPQSRFLMRKFIFQVQHKHEFTLPTVTRLSTQKPPKHLVIRWATLKGLAAIVLFLVVTILVEYLVVLYAMSLGVEEKPESLLQWSFQFPGTGWMMKIVISPLFHLVPIAAIVALVSSWTYLTKHAAVKPGETHKGKAEVYVKRGREPRLKEVKKFFGKVKSGLLRVRGLAYLWQKIHFARATIKSALTVLLVFLALILMVSILAYPQLIYQTILNGYANNPSLLSFVRGTSQVLAPVGGIFSGISNALLSGASGFGGFASSFGTIIGPLADLDNAGKYLVFQNAAAWVSALVALLYGERLRKGHRYRKTRKS